MPLRQRQRSPELEEGLMSGRFIYSQRLTTRLLLLQTRKAVLSLGLARELWALRGQRRQHLLPLLKLLRRSLRKLQKPAPTLSIFTFLALAPEEIPPFAQ